MRAGRECPFWRPGLCGRWLHSESVILPGEQVLFPVDELSGVDSIVMLSETVVVCAGTKAGVVDFIFVVESRLRLTGGIRLLKSAAIGL